MRVLFLTLYPEAAASPRYRVHQFLPYLKDAGWDCTVAAPLSEAAWRRHTGPDRAGRAFWYHAHECWNRIHQLLLLKGYDVIFLQKALMTAYLRGLPKLLDRRDGALVYDIDDAVHLGPPHPLSFPWNLLEDVVQIRKIARRAALVLPGNRWLTQWAKDEGARAEYFPTVVDTHRFVPPQISPGQFCVGWIGTPGTTPHLNLIADVLSEMPDAQIRVIGAEAKRLRCASAAIQTWRYEEEVTAIQQFSVGLLPQPRDTWTQGKCALKALLYMACGVPCLATPYGAVLDIIEPGVNGLFADSPSEWRSALDQLRDPSLRRQLGEAARATVEEHFSLERTAPRFKSLLESVVP